jgi:hypothetical protein
MTGCDRHPAAQPGVTCDLVTYIGILAYSQRRSGFEAAACDGNRERELRLRGAIVILPGDRKGRRCAMPISYRSRSRA